MKIITFLSILVLQTCISKPKPTDNIEKNWSPQKITQNNYEKAYFASGCFWCVEAIYESVKGVIEVYSGYAGGITKNPNYYQIGTGRTGHAEAVEVIYDPNLVTYATLVQVFFGSHDPTTPNRQGPDYGSQYRSIAFYKTKEEKNIIEKYIKILKDGDYFQKEIINHFNLDSHIDDFISSEEVKYGRPYPYMIHELMTRFDIRHPKHVAKVGDTKNDMKEGVNARCGINIGVLSGFESKDRLFESGADVVVNKITDLNKHDDLPVFLL